MSPRPKLERVELEPVASRPRERREILGSRPLVYPKVGLDLVVREAVIVRSVPRNQFLCVMSNTCRATVSDLVDVAVTRSRAWLVFGPDGPDGWVDVYEPSGPLSRQIIRYDETALFVPGLYSLRPLRDSAKPDWKQGSHGRSWTGGRRERAKTIPLNGVMLKRNEVAL